MPAQPEDFFIVGFLDGQGRECYDKCGRNSTRRYDMHVVFRTSPDDAVYAILRPSRHGAYWLTRLDKIMSRPNPDKKPIGADYYAGEIFKFKTLSAVRMAAAMGA